MRAGRGHSSPLLCQSLRHPIAPTFYDKPHDMASCLELLMNIRSRQDRSAGQLRCYYFWLVPIVLGSSSAIISRVKRPKPAGLVCHLSAFPESAASVPEANLNTPFPEASLPAGLPSFIIAEPTPSVSNVTASPPTARTVPPPV